MRTVSILTAVVMLGSFLVVGCGDDDAADQALAKMRSCDLLTAGRMDVDVDTSNPEDECYFDCAIAASCDDLTAMICGVGSPSASLVQCQNDCETRYLFHCVDGSDDISQDWVCDGYDDCDDASDEAGCSYFDCADGSDSISLSYVCDYEDDCEDGSDEVGCPSMPQFRCSDGSFIEAWYDCDGEPDCPDGSDEQGCAQLTCPQ